MTVTNNIRVIDGAPARAIDDRLFLGGALKEKTTDWYTQDNGGNVWYYDHKYYVRGVGTVLEQSVKAPLERNALTGFLQKGQ
jgi:GTPase